MSVPCNSGDDIRSRSTTNRMSYAYDNDANSINNGKSNSNIKDNDNTSSCSSISN